MAGLKLCEKILVNISALKFTHFNSLLTRRMFHTTPTSCSTSFEQKKKKKTVEQKQDSGILVKQAEFLSLEEKNKTSFADMVKTFELANPNRRGHVEFIYAALKVMKDFEVEKDITYYKKLLDIFPKGKMIPTNSIQVQFIHFPLQQQCAVQVLEQMEENGIGPDEDIQMIIMQAFGYRSLPFKKVLRMNYWMQKFRYASPFPLPKTLPDDTLQIAKLAVERMTSVDLQTAIDTFQTSEVPDSVDKTWIVSGQSPDQQRLLRQHPTGSPLYIDGAFRIWLRNTSIAYFVLRGEPNSNPYKGPTKEELDDVSHLENPFDGIKGTSVSTPMSIHEQEDSTIFAICATGTSSRDSLLSWLRILHQTNPALHHIPVIFTLKAPILSVVPLNFSVQENSLEDSTDTIEKN